MGDNKTIKKLIRNSVMFFIIVLVIVVIALIILRYHVEGEQNMPFELSEVLVVSTAEGHQEKQSEKAKWDVELYQTNDIYLTLKKNKNIKGTNSIKSVELKNIIIDNKPSLGNVSFYLPKEGSSAYEYKEEDKIQDSVTFEGDTKSDIRNLKIANQGGTIIFRAVNKTGKRYLSNEDEIKQDGTLFKKANISLENMKTTISFDFIINLDSEVSFTGHITIDLPAGDITEQGVSSLDKAQMKEIIFKRE